MFTNAKTVHLYHFYFGYMYLWILNSFNNFDDVSLHLKCVRLIFFSQTLLRLNQYNHLKCHIFFQDGDKSYSVRVFSKSMTMYIFLFVGQPRCLIQSIEVIRCTLNLLPSHGHVNWATPTVTHKAKVLFQLRDTFFLNTFCLDIDLHNHYHVRYVQYCPIRKLCHHKPMVLTPLELYARDSATSSHIQKLI